MKCLPKAKGDEFVDKCISELLEVDDQHSCGWCFHNINNRCEKKLSCQYSNIIYLNGTCCFFSEY